MTTGMNAPRPDAGGARDAAGAAGGRGDRDSGGRGDRDDDGLDRDGDDRRGGKGGRGTSRRKLLSDEIVAKIDYKNPQILRSFVTDRGKMIPRRISGASARQQRVISTAIRRARMLALLPFSVTGD